MWSGHGDRKITVEGVPTITLSREFARKMRHLVINTPTEISWVGEVEGDPRDSLVVTKLHIMKQKVSGATFEEEDNAFLELRDRIGDAVFKIRCHCHSHVNMGVTPSGTDQKHTVDNWKALEVPFLIRLIANKAGLLRCDFFDFERGVNVECAKFEVQDEETSFPELDAEVAAHVSPFPPPVPAQKNLGQFGPGYKIGGNEPSAKPSKPNGKSDEDNFWLYDDTDEPWWRAYKEYPEETEAQKRAKARKFAHFWRGVW